MMTVFVNPEAHLPETATTSVSVSFICDRSYYIVRKRAKCLAMVISKKKGDLLNDNALLLQIKLK